MLQIIKCIDIINKANKKIDNKRIVELIVRVDQRTIEEVFL